MKVKQDKELQLAYGLAIVLFIIGIACFASYSEEPPETPIRVMFKTAAGNVLFDHTTHYDLSGYGITCKDCHHHYEEENKKRMGCVECHSSKESMTVPQTCRDCHDVLEDHHPLVADDETKACVECHIETEDGEFPESCSECHEPDEIDKPAAKMDFQKRTDAFHNQCIGCHKQYDKGPVECSGCHVM